MKDRRKVISGDSAYVWHCLDVVLRKICEARDSLTEAGFERHAEELQTVVDALEIRYSEAEENLMEAMEDGSQESSGFAG